MNFYTFYPMKLRPVLKNIVWGGTRLANEYGKSDNSIEVNQKIAESWELCVHANGTNIIENGCYAGKNLEELFSGNKAIVSSGYSAEKFPILIKFIDAAQDLSVQVHPDNEYAARVSGELGKTEMWYIIDCELGAKIAYGLNADYTREQLRRHINSGTLESCLNYIAVTPGDVFFIPAGLIHAIGAGVLIAEIQQNSDTTYRMYDYNRADAYGKLRELHIEQALDVCITTKTQSGHIKQPNSAVLSRCKCFSVYKDSLIDIGSENSDGFHSIICLGGTAKIIHNDIAYAIKKGDSYFIPAGIGKYAIENARDFSFILTTLGSFG